MGLASTIDSASRPFSMKILNVSMLIECLDPGLFGQEVISTVGFGIAQKYKPPNGALRGTVTGFGNTIVDNKQRSKKSISVGERQKDLSEVKHIANSISADAVNDDQK